MSTPTAMPASLDRRSLYEEILIVLALTVLASAAFAVISLVSAPIRGVAVTTTTQTLVLARHLAGLVFFGLAPVWLVVYLLRRSGEGVVPLGLTLRDLPAGIPLGAYLALLVSISGLGLYIVGYAYGFTRIVIPVPPLEQWWTIPVLVLDAFQNGLYEEVIVAGYLLHRLGQAGWRPAPALWLAAVIRGSYHLYQGYGAFVGNLVMGLFFGLIWQRTRRTWPLVVAHGLIDVAAGIGYIYFRGRLELF
ncbi:MAG: type II CAAX endopeptidase family protein [Actinomycetota bacterium]